MKKIIIQTLTAFMAILFVTSCDWDPVMFDSSKSFVAFTSRQATIPEDKDMVGIPVMVVAAEGSPAVTVTFDFDTAGIEMPAVEGEDFTLVNSEKTLTFPDGWGYDTIWIQPVDNDIFTGNKTFTINLQTNSEDYAFGSNYFCEAKLLDDEHPLGKWIGTYTVAAASYGNPGEWDETWSVVTQPDESDVNNLLITISADQAGIPFTATLDLDAMTITIPAGTNAGPVYAYGPTEMYVGDYATLDEESPIVGTIEEDGTIHIDQLAMYLPDHDYYWDAFNTEWTKTGKKAAFKEAVDPDKLERINY